jgi:hypothetical protein
MIRGSFASMNPTRSSSAAFSSLNIPSRIVDVST